MKYQVNYEKKAIKYLNKLDKEQQRFIISWIEKNLVNTEYPRQQGKALKGALGMYWRYRVGNYRIIAEIKDNTIEINIITIGHRKDIYKKI